MHGSVYILITNSPGLPVLRELYQVALDFIGALRCHADCQRPPVLHSAPVPVKHACVSAFPPLLFPLIFLQRHDRAFPVQVLPFTHVTVINKVEWVTQRPCVIAAGTGECL